MARIKAFNKEEVLKKAVDLFWAQGYNATSANDLVNHLGLSRSSLYDTFGDKRQLFLLSLEQYHNKIIGQMISFIENSDDIRATLVSLFEFIIDQDIASKVPKGCFMVNSAIELSAFDPEIAVIVNANQRSVEHALEMALEKARQNGQLRASYNPDSLSKFFFNTISGIRVAIRSKQDPKALKEIVKVSLLVLEA